MNDFTIIDRLIAPINVDELQYVVEIRETEEIDDYPEWIDPNISFGEGFLLVFAINDSNSFQLLKEKREKIIKLKKGENPHLY